MLAQHHVSAGRRGGMRVLLVVAALAVFALACETVLDPSLTELEAGDCVRDPGAVTEVQKLETVEADTLRVTKTFEITGHDSYPGDLELQGIAIEGCSPAALWLVPTEESWNKADDRKVVCFQ
jgi:hypothetical protein